MLCADRSFVQEACQKKLVCALQCANVQKAGKALLRWVPNFLGELQKLFKVMFEMTLEAEKLEAREKKPVDKKRWPSSFLNLNRELKMVLIFLYRPC